MVEHLVLLHQREGGERSAFDGLDSSYWTTWNTCLRRIAFGFDESSLQLNHSNAMPSQFKFEIYRGLSAYQFLLEIICGLHSPVVGETEVMGQFRELLERPSQSEYRFSAQLQRIFTWALADSKSIRQNHLRELGSKSYGSLMRRYIRESKSVSFIGSGKLVKEILPWVHDKVKEVKVFCRNQEQGEELKKTFSKIVVHPLKALDRDNAVAGVLIIAAPLESETLQTWIQKQSTTQIIDLRHSALSDAITTRALVLKLHDLFSELEKFRNEAEIKVAQAKKEISNLVEKRLQGAEIRPFGWEDLCG